MRRASRYSGPISEVDVLASPGLEAATPQAPAEAPIKGRDLRPADALVPIALVLWLLAVHAVHPDAMDDWGLFTVLPIIFFIALGLLVASITVALTDAKLSSARLGLCLVALVLILHGTVPMIFPVPTYPWVYKHIGVVGYINLHGSTATSVDIYQNWPGFFAVAAFFTRVAGLSSPLAFAKWAPVYFNLLICLELAFAFRYLPVARRVRWLAMFLFVAGNWVGQDYFAPQAVSFVLCLAAFGTVLAWFRPDRRPAVVGVADRLAQWARRAPRSPETDGEVIDIGRQVSRPGRAIAVVVLFSVFAAVVVSHQLSPYLVLLSVGSMTALGMVRPRWVVLGLAALAIGYLSLRLSYLHRSHYLRGSPLNPRELLASLSNPFDNAHTNGFQGGRSMPGRAITATGAPALMLGLWALAVIGALRRLRARLPTLLLIILAGSPALLALGQDYGGEAIFRIFLFSLPWTAILGASFLAPRSGRWGPRTGLRIGLALSVVLLLFMSAFYGSVELYRVRPGEVQATQYFFDHASRGSVLGSATPNIPARLGDRYDLFLTGSTPPPLTSIKELQHRILGVSDVPVVSALYQEHAAATAGGLYLILGTDQQVYAKVTGLLPDGSLASLDRALSQSPDWEVFDRNRDAVIYRFAGAHGTVHPGQRIVS